MSVVNSTSSGDSVDAEEVGDAEVSTHRCGPSVKLEGLPTADAVDVHVVHRPEEERDPGTRGEKRQSVVFADGPRVRKQTTAPTASGRT
jgi:hypothetical protein